MSLQPTFPHEAFPIGTHEVTPEEIARGLRVLQLGAMYGTAVAVRRMLPHRAGAIVNISSIQGVAAFPRYVRSPLYD